MLPKDSERENRIYDEIIVDAHGEYEQRTSWYCHMDEKLRFPFKAEVVLEKRSGEKIVQKVDVLKLTCDEEFGSDLTVGVAYADDLFSVKLTAIRHVEADEGTLEAIEDWQYWRDRYEF